MLVDYQSLFQVRLANYDDIESIMSITREAFMKYKIMEKIAEIRPPILDEI